MNKRRRFKAKRARAMGKLYAKYYDLSTMSGVFAPHPKRWETFKRLRALEAAGVVANARAR